MKLRLKQPGFETYTGQMGTVFFDNGTSTKDVGHLDAVRIAAQFLCEWEDGSTASVAQSILDHAHATTHTIPTAMNADQALAAQSNGTTAQAAAERPDTARTYTEQELADLADTDGIKALRAIAEPLGVKGSSISDLIKAILAKQA